MHLYILVIRFSLGVVLAAGVLALAPALAAGPTGLLNDTGHVFCDNGSLQAS